MTVFKLKPIKSSNCQIFMYTNWTKHTYFSQQITDSYMNLHHSSSIKSPCSVQNLNLKLWYISLNLICSNLGLNRFLDSFWRTYNSAIQNTNNVELLAIVNVIFGEQSNLGHFWNICSNWNAWFFESSYIVLIAQLL